MYSTLSGDLSRFTTSYFQFSLWGALLASANKLIWPSVCTLFHIYTKYNNTSASLQAMSYETKYRKPAGFFMFVSLCAGLGPKHSHCYGFSYEDAITPAPALSITGVCLIDFPPSMLKQTAYIITVAPSGKKRKKSL